MMPGDLTPVPRPPDDRLAAAARAAVAWARARQASWEEDEQTPFIPEPAALPAVPSPPVQVTAAPPAVPPPPVKVTTAPPAVPPSPVQVTAAATPPAPAVEPAVPVPDVPGVTPAAVEPSEPVVPDGPSLLTSVASAAGAALPMAGRFLAVAALVVGLIAAGVAGRDYLRHRAALAAVGTAQLDSVPPGSEVVVDGRPLGPTPLTATLGAGTHTVEFQYRGRSGTLSLLVPGGGRVEKLWDWTRKPTGSLSVTTQPVGARVLIDGKLRGRTPLVIRGLTTGHHTVVMESRQGTIQRAVTIGDGQTTDVSESIFPGWVKVFAPFNVTATEDGHVLALDDTGQVMLPAGSHEIRFENHHFGYVEVRKVDVQPGGQTTISLVPPPSSLTVTASAPAQVWIDGSPVGSTPLTGHPIDLGIRNVTVKSATGQERQFVLTVTAKPIVLAIDFSKPSAGP